MDQTEERTKDQKKKILKEMEKSMLDRSVVSQHE